MSEQTGAPAASEPATTSTTEPQATEPVVQGDPADKPLGPNGEKALRAERDRADALEKNAKSLEAQLNAIQTERQAALDEIERLKADLPKQVTSELRKHLVALHGISAEDADLFLTGSDPETLLKQVSRLVDRVAAPTTPRPDPSQGHKGDPPALNSSRLEDALVKAVGADPRR